MRSQLRGRGNPTWRGQAASTAPIVGTASDPLENPELAAALADKARQADITALTQAMDLGLSGVIAKTAAIELALPGKADDAELLVFANSVAAALDLKQPIGSYAPASHSHDIAGVTGLVEALEGKQPAGNYLTSLAGLTSLHVITALGFTPYNATNPSGYITGITGAMVTAALGYTPQVAGSYQPLNQRLTDLAALGYTGNGGKVLKVNAGGTGWELSADLTGAGGGVDPWTRTVLAADFNNATVTPATITGFTYTPPANSNWELKAQVLIWTTAIANLPMISLTTAAGAAQGYGAVDIAGPGATVNAAPVAANGGWNNPAAATSISMAAGGVSTASVPFLVMVRARGRSGATPQAMAIQMRAETAAAATCFVKAGSEMMTRAGY